MFFFNVGYFCNFVEKQLIGEKVKKCVSDKEYLFSKIN